MPRTVSFIVGGAVEPQVEEHKLLVDVLPLMHVVSRHAVSAVLHANA
jgi:hypothetical protein